MSIFHQAFNVADLAGARAFCGERLGCAEGRSTETLADVDRFGSHISPHPGAPFAPAPTHEVGDPWVPMPHSGKRLGLEEWRALADRREGAGQDGVIAPMVLFEGQPGEQAAMIRLDPFGNPLGSKDMQDPAVSAFAA